MEQQNKLTEKILGQQLNLHDSTLFPWGTLNISESASKNYQISPLATSGIIAENKDQENLDLPVNINITILNRNEIDNSLLTLKATKTKGALLENNVGKAVALIQDKKIDIGVAIRSNHQDIVDFLKKNSYQLSDPIQSLFKDNNDIDNDIKYLASHALVNDITLTVNDMTSKILENISNYALDSGAYKNAARIGFYSLAATASTIGIDEVVNNHIDPWVVGIGLGYLATNFAMVFKKIKHHFIETANNRHQHIELIANQNSNIISKSIHNLLCIGCFTDEMEKKYKND